MQSPGACGSRRRTSLRVRGLDMLRELRRDAGNRQVGSEAMVPGGRKQPCNHRLSPFSEEMPRKHLEIAVREEIEAFRRQLKASRQHIACYPVVQRIGTVVDEIPEDQ